VRTLILPSCMQISPKASEGLGALNGPQHGGACATDQRVTGLACRLHSSAVVCTGPLLPPQRLHWEEGTPGMVSKYRLTTGGKQVSESREQVTFCK
jgi:hypothetical protein